MLMCDSMFYVYSMSMSIDFNQGETLEQTKTKSGDDCYVCFSKITKTWSAKPI